MMEQLSSPRLCSQARHVSECGFLFQKEEKGIFLSTYFSICGTEKQTSRVRNRNNRRIEYIDSNKDPQLCLPFTQLSVPLSSCLSGESNNPKFPKPSTLSDKETICRGELHQSTKGRSSVMNRRSLV